MSGLTAYIARLLRDALGHNTLNTPTVPVIFQRSPGIASGNDRGIQDLDYRVMAGTAVVQTGRTGPDGRIDVRLQGGAVTLELLHAGTTVARYNVRARADAIEDVATTAGQQRRLRMLGYQIGPAGTDRVGVDGSTGRRTDRAVLEFQADKGLETDGVPGTNTQNGLTTDAGA